MLSIEYKYFLQSAKDLSIRRASVYLNVNSSAVVRQIKKLEHNLNAKLFIRNSRGLVLTNQGKILYEFLLTQEHINSDFKVKFNIEKGKIKGKIRIGMMESVGGNILSQVINKYILNYPDIKFDINPKKPENIIDELIEQKIDLGITFSDMLPKSIKKIYETKFQLGIVISINHPLQFKKIITLEDLKDYPLILHTGALSYLKQKHRDIGLDLDSLDISITSNSQIFIKKILADNNHSVSLSLATINDPFSESIIFKPIENEVTKNTKVGIIARRSKKFNKNEEVFNNILIEEFKKFNKN